jgi:hypothetical protein
VSAVRTFQQIKIGKLYSKKFYICCYTTFFFYISVTYGVQKHVAIYDYYNRVVYCRAVSASSNSTHPTATAQTPSHSSHASNSQQISNTPLQGGEKKQHGKFKVSFVCKTPRKTRKLDATSAVFKRQGDEHCGKGSVRTSGRGRRR